MPVATGNDDERRLQSLKNSQEFPQRQRDYNIQPPSLIPRCDHPQLVTASNMKEKRRSIVYCDALIAVDALLFLFPISRIRLCVASMSASSPLPVAVARRFNTITQHMQMSSNDTAGSSAPTAGLNIAVSTHVLDTATGHPARDMRVVFEAQTAPDVWTQLGEGRTNSDGRIGTFPPIQTTAPTADYRLRFFSGEYLVAQGHAQPFFPQVTIQWQVNQKTDKDRTKLHVPLLLSPFGYSSYRGS